MRTPTSLRAFLFIAFAACSGSNEAANAPTVNVSPASTASAAPSETSASETTGSAASPGATSSVATGTQATALHAPAFSAVAPALSPNAAKAETLFQEARAAMAAGDFATACSKFDASLKLDFGLGTLMNLAECVSKSGDRARACNLYGQAAAEAHANKQTEREQVIIAKRTSLGCGP